MTRRIQLALLFAALALVSASVPSAAQVTPTMHAGHNGMDTSFARIQSDPRPLYTGANTAIEARVLVKNGSGVLDAFILMFGFNGLSDTVDVRMEDLLIDGKPVAIEKDDRGESLRQPKVWVKPQNLSLGKEVVMRATVTAHGNGQFHVGAIVIAFDEKYEKMVTPANEYAEVYTFGLLSVKGLAGGPGRPPFEGQGNVPSIGLVAAMAVVVAVAVLSRRRD